MKTTIKNNVQSVSNETKQSISVENQVSNECISVEDATTTKSAKAKCIQSEPSESPKKRLLNLIEKKTGLNFEGSTECKEFYKNFAILKDANEGAFFAALASVKKQWEDANKSELEKVENIAPVEFFEGLLNDNEIKNLLNDVFCNSFDYKNIIEGNNVICYCSESKDEESTNAKTIKKLDLFGKEHAQIVYYKKIDCTRTNYLRALRGYSYYIEGQKRLKNQLNKANAAFSDLRNILQTLKDNGAAIEDVTRITNEIFN
ncbi:hypothetical protein [Prevotella disiens]|uniref:hypothetical protein n=1 Tax=Prevotella disiens TaxID=28130 RepID=UPI0024326A08|nr:hypothetical protein [Prevotella disiens]